MPWPNQNRAIAGNVKFYFGRTPCILFTTLYIGMSMNAISDEDLGQNLADEIGLIVLNQRLTLGVNWDDTPKMYSGDYLPNYTKHTYSHRKTLLKPRDCGSVSSSNNINNIENPTFLEINPFARAIFPFQYATERCIVTKNAHLRVIISKKVDYLYHCRVFKHLDYIVESIS